MLKQLNLDLHFLTVVQLLVVAMTVVQLLVLVAVLYVHQLELLNHHLTFVL
jgi:hypothetical protein